MSSKYFPGKQLSFMGTAIKFVSEISFLGESIKNNDVTDQNISKTSRKFYHKANQVMNDFIYLYRNIKSQLLSSCCLDAYGSQLWPFYDTSVNFFMSHGDGPLENYGLCPIHHIVNISIQLTIHC